MSFIYQNIKTGEYMVTNKRGLHIVDTTIIPLNAEDLVARIKRIQNALAKANALCENLKETNASLELQFRKENQAL